MITPSHTLTRLDEIFSVMTIAGYDAKAMGDHNKIAKAILGCCKNNNAISWGINRSANRSRDVQAHVQVPFSSKWRGAGAESRGYPAINRCY